MSASPRSPSMGSDLRKLVLAATLGAVVMAAVVWAIGRMKAPAQRGRIIGARLELVAGDVTVRDGEIASKALSGTPLGSGATVITAKGSRAFVRASDGTGVFLRGESEVMVADRSLSLEKGEVWLDASRVQGAPSSCKAGSHSLTAADSGMSVRRQEDQIAVYVARGLATLNSPGGRVEIHAGEQAVAKASEAPKVSPVAFWDDWTGGMGDTRASRSFVGSGSGRIYGLNPSAPAASPASKLGISKQVVRAVVREGMAETEVDQTFSNPGGQPIEGWYWFTLPPEASVTSFALETDGVLIEGEITEKQEAAAKYAAAVRSGNDPALLEWVDGRSYRARIFPIPANGTRRVVLRYVQLLGLVEGKHRYVYPMRSEDSVRFDEFALSVDLGADASNMTVATSLDALVEAGGRKVTMRRSGYVPRADFQLEMVRKGKVEPVRAWRFEAGTDKADYVMARCVPDVDLAALPPVKGEIVVVVDTSAGGDESARQLRASTAETILRSLSAEDRFALMSLDVTASVLYPKQGLSPATDVDIARALEQLSDHPAAGATDLAALFEPALGRLHGGEQPAIVYVGDGTPTSGEWTPEALAERLRRSLAGSRARLFMVGVGSDARHDLMDHLARAGGGRYLRVADADQATGQALQLASFIKTPTISDIQLDLGAGLDQPFTSTAGTLSRGEELLLVARTHHALPKTATLKGRIAGKEFKTEYPIAMQSGVTTSLVPRFWASEFMRQLLGSGALPDENRSKVLELGMDYGLMSPYTSILALESEAAYSQQNVKRRKSPLRGIRLTSLVSDQQENNLAALLQPLPAAAIGCCGGRSRPESSEPPSIEQAGQPRKGKGSDEESSGNQGARETEKRSIAPGAKANANSPSTHTQAERDGAEFGMIGLLNKGDIPSGAANPYDGKPDPQGAAEPAAKAPPARQPGANKVGAAPPPKPEAKKVPQTGKQDKDAQKPLPKPVPATVPRQTPDRCSDSAARPLPERIVLWGRRLKQAVSAVDLLRQYEMARAGCELPDWKDQAALLDLLQKRINTEEAAEVMLSHFAAEKDAQQFVARRILRRTTEPRVAAAVARVLFGGKVDWTVVDRELLDIQKPEDRLEHVRKAMLVAPGDPNGDARVVRLLKEAGKVSEAVAHGRRLRDRGFMTPMLALQLGDALVQSGDREEALRTYSEIVEFDATHTGSRRVLGDTFLRHGWYQAAYRQYRNVAALEPRNAVNWLRLAAAAAGAGRTDEALRLEREVAAGEGTPGPNDPRLWARLWSAARLGMLLSDPKPAGGKDAVESLVRKLKELQLFSGPGTLALLTWEDLEASLVLAMSDGDKGKMVDELTDAGASGLYAVLTARETWDKGAWSARWKSDPRGRNVKLALVVVQWNGKAFEVKVQRGEIKTEDREARF